MPSGCKARVEQSQNRFGSASETRWTTTGARSCSWMGLGSVFGPHGVNDPNLQPSIADVENVLSY